MIIALAFAGLALVVGYFIYETGRPQNLHHDYSIFFSPRETVLETRLDVRSSPEAIWKELLALSNYHLWFPWIHRVKVRNDTPYFARRVSLDHFRPEVGNRFATSPFLGAPHGGGRFLSIDRHRRLELEMRFLPLTREIVSFEIEPNGQATTLTYRSRSRGPMGLLAASLFFTGGREILHRLAPRLPVMEFAAPAKAVPTPSSPKEEPIVLDEAFVNAIVSRALVEGIDLLNGIQDKPLRAQAKSLFTRMKRAGQSPQVTPAGVSAVSRFLSKGGVAPAAATQPVAAPAAPAAAPTGEDAEVASWVARAFADGEDVLNTITDRVLRAKTKAAFVKAKRSGVKPEIVAQAAPILQAPAPPPAAAPSAPPSPSAAPTGTGAVDELVRQALAAGTMDAINAIQDKALRGAAKSAYIKAKRQQGAE